MGVAGADGFDNLNSDGVQGTLTVGTTAVEVKVGASPHIRRRLVVMSADDNSIYWGYTSGVTISTGIRIYKNQTVWIPAGEELTIFAIADDAGKTLRVHEVA